MSTRPLAYELKQLNPPTDMRTAAMLTCAKCGATQKIPIMAWGNKPEKIILAFIRLGWSADQHKASACICPRCVNEREVRAEETASNKDQASMLTTARPIAPPPLNIKSVRSIKDLSPNQKTALRLRLEKVFDDATGRYIDHQSDHIISEQMDIPRAVVVEYRELVFGPLKDDPEINDLRSLLSDLKKIIGDVQARLDKAEIRINAVSKKNGL